MRLLVFLSLFTITAALHAQIRIVEVVPSTNTITIKNFGSSTVDISSYRLCTIIRYTSNLTTGITVNSGSMNLTAGSEVEFVAPGGASGSWPNLSSEADLGLYLPTGSFGSTSAMVDFTQWGSGGHGRESVAVSKGIWSTGDFVSGNEPYNYIGNGSQNGVAFWEGFTPPNNDPTDISLSNSSINENLLSGSEVGTLTTTDVDGSDTHTYDLVPGTGDDDNGSFSIDGSILRSAASFDFEAKSTYSVRIQTDDGNGGTFSKSFTISVSDVPEAPTDITLSNQSVAENESSGTTIGTLTTTDEDNDEAYTYNLVAGEGDEDNGSFDVSGATLVSMEAFNFEVKSTYNIRIETDDNNGGTFEKNFTISITNVAEPPTDIQISNQTIAENQPVGTSIGTFSTTDEDEGESYDYSLISGTGDDDNASFTITTGELKSNEIFDLETKSIYSILVETDDGNGNKFSKVFTVTITGENETPTDISISATSINENEIIGTSIGMFSTLDVDASDTHTYTLIAGEGDGDNASFSVSGMVLVSAEAFDFEVKSSFRVRIQTRDNVGATFSKAFSITILDVQESPTGINLDSQTIDENQVATTTIGTFTTIDEDTEDIHTYSLVMGEGDADNDAFSIEGSLLKAKAPFNFEIKSSYSIRVQTDDGGSNPFSETFEIAVQDVNEAPISITLSSSEISENVDLGFEVGILTTEDEDAEDSFTYSLTTGTGDDNNDLFRIENDKLIVDADLTSETSPLTLRIQSTDLGDLSVQEALEIVLVPVLGLDAPDVKIYPNPASEVFFTEIDSETYLHYTLTNVSGMQIMTGEKNISTKKIIIPTTDLPAGVYYFKIITPQYSTTKPIIIKR